MFLTGKKNTVLMETTLPPVATGSPGKGVTLEGKNLLHLEKLKKR